MLTEKLGICFPLIQAPMAGASSHPDLTVAVSQAGALGSYGAGYLPPEKIREVIRTIRSQTDAPFNMNLFVPTPYEDNSEKKEASMEAMVPYFQELGIELKKPVSYAPSFDKQMEVILEEKVPVFSFTFGIPDDKWLQRLREQKTVIIGTATHLAEITLLAEKDVDFIVVQGGEAGGHRGTFMGQEEAAVCPIKKLAAKTKIKTPLIAAGGIMNREGIEEAMSWGIAGVQMGTAFLTAKECPIHPKYNEILLSQKEDNTELTRAFSGRLARGIRNQFLTEMAHVPVPDYPIQHALTKELRIAAAKQNRTEFMSLWAGQNAYLCQDKTVAELIQEFFPFKIDKFRKLSRSPKTNF